MAKAKWTDGESFPVPHLDGCVDVDLVGSPFTNTLPIRRAALPAGGEAAEYLMAFVPFDTLDPFVDSQRYRCLDADRRFRFEAVDASFTADITVDDDGLVTDYPGLFKRLPK
jgi:hypothetical protein